MSALLAFKGIRGFSLYLKDCVDLCEVHIYRFSWYYHFGWCKDFKFNSLFIHFLLYWLAWTNIYADAFKILHVPARTCTLYSVQLLWTKKDSMLSATVCTSIRTKPSKILHVFLIISYYILTIVTRFRQIVCYVLVND